MPLGLSKGSRPSTRTPRRASWKQAAEPMLPTPTTMTSKVWGVSLIDISIYQRAGDGLIGHAGNPICSRQRELGHCGGLDGEGDQVFALQVMHVGFSTGSGEGGEFHVEHAKIVFEPLRAGGRIEPLLEDGVLRGDA